MESSDFDETVAEQFREKTVEDLFQEYILLLNNMNDDLVFGGKHEEEEKLSMKQVEFQSTSLNFSERSTSSLFQNRLLNTLTLQQPTN